MGGPELGAVELEPGEWPHDFIFSLNKFASFSLEAESHPDINYWEL